VRVVRLGDDAIISRGTISEHPPVISALDLERDRQPVRGEVTLTWSASDADGDPLSFDILVSHDAGDTFEPLQFALAGTSTSVNTDELPGGVCVLRLVASDGVHVAQEDAESFQIANKPPEPYVNLPVDSGSWLSLARSLSRPLELPVVLGMFNPVLEIKNPVFLRDHP
jgi:hypothetical protein